MVSSLWFTCSAIILLMDIRLSVMLLLVSASVSLVALLRQKHTQSRPGDALLLLPSSVKQEHLQSGTGEITCIITASTKCLGQMNW